MVAFVIVLEILLPTVVLGCFRRRKYMEMLAIKIIRSILTLPFLFWVVQAHLTIIKMINDTILSGYFLQDRTIVFGGAFDQPGLFKQGVLMFYALMGVVSILGLHRMWLKSAPPILTRILCCVTGCMLVLEIGPLIVYHWYLFRYIAANGTDTLPGGRACLWRHPVSRNHSRLDIFGLSLCQAECACVRWTVRIHSGCRALKSDMIEAFGREKIEKPNKIRGLAGEKILCSVR